MVIVISKGIEVKKSGEFFPIFPRKLLYIKNPEILFD